MKSRNLFQKIVLIALVLLVLFALVVPIAFSQVAAKPHEERLLNGLRVLMWPDAKAPNVSVRIRVHAGSAFDPQGKTGVMQMLADNLFPNEAAREFFREDLGGGLEVISTYDFIQINASAEPKNDNLLSMLETLATAVSNTAIDKETTARLRTAQLARIKTQENDVAYVAIRGIESRLFGTFPYGRPQLGTAETVAKLDFADLIDAKQRFLTADNATIAVSGNFDRALAFRAIRRYFGNWLRADKAVPVTFRQPDEPESAPALLTSAAIKVPVVRMAFRGVAVSDKDYFAAQLLAKVLTMRLLATQPQVLAGDAIVTHEGHILPGAFVVASSVTPKWFEASAKPVDASVKTIASALAAALAAELARPITESEFTLARTQTQLDYVSRPVADWYLDEDTFKLGSAAAAMQAQRSVTIADVRRVAERMAKNRVAITIVIPAP